MLVVQRLIVEYLIAFINYTTTKTRFEVVFACFSTIIFIAN